MGLGDVTLMAFIGAAVGPQRAIITVFLAAVLGTVIMLAVMMPLGSTRRSTGRSAQTELALGPVGMSMPLVPFGVFLAPAALITLLWGDALIRILVR
jgi:leader peptidase (prepilin peptidase)/N-methyltransferase